MAVVRQLSVATSGRVLTIEKSAASLNRVAFVSVVDKQELSYFYYQSNCSVLDQIISAVDRVIGISSRSSSISITHSLLEDNNVGPIGAVISDEFGSDIVIINTTFIKNSASDLYAQYVCHCHSDCYYDSYNITSGIVHTSDHGSVIKIYDSMFVQNEGIVIFGESCNMLITHTMFMNNIYSGDFVATVGVTDANLVITHSTFANNTGYVLDIRNTDMSISHSEFISNQNGYATVYIYSGVITSIDHSNFINNTGYKVLHARNTNVSISYSEFIGNENEYGVMLYYIGTITSIEHTEFINNTGYSVLDAQNTNILSTSHSEFIGNENHGEVLYVLNGTITSIHHSKFINNTGYSVLDAQNTNVLSTSQSEFIGNENHGEVLRLLNGTVISIHHSKFINNTGYRLLYASDTDIIINSVTHNEFIDNTVDDVVLYFEQVMITLHLNEFINNIADRAVVYISYYTTAEN